MPQLTSTTRKWTVVDCPPEQSPPGRIGHTFCANADGTKAYVYGGVNDLADSTSNYLDDLWEYDVIEKKWTERELSGEPQHPRAFHTAVWYRDRMYIFGGCNGHGRFNKLFTIKANGERQSVPLSAGMLTPSTRYCHSAVVFEGSMYVFGGKCGGRNSNKRLSDLYSCNLDTGVWQVRELAGDHPPPRSAHTALTHERIMMIFGGRNSDGECCEDFYMFHFDTQLWRKITTQQPSLFGRARNSAVVHFGNVFVFGGWNGKKKLNDLFIYNVEGNVFDFFFDVDRSCPSRRECHVAVMCRNTMVVFGGRFRGNFMTDTAELYLGPKTGADSAQDWLLHVRDQPGLTAYMDSLGFPLRLMDSYRSHEMIHKVLPKSEPLEEV